MSTSPVGIVTRFEVDSVLSTKSGSEILQFSAVTPSATKPENRVFSNFTPQGQIALTITNPDAFGLFEPGDEYRVTFEKVSSRAQA
ncbi:hypothetical protein [Spirosoma fluviale]|uniref:Uncharacterized protein n=1 Tax=Spirosoma fluviale TaxID=1597977 RepID=A0A286FCQ6_9BACT|nr:hypothetical protein [Spirosoma fluviale]SOD80980.1 hypothetical protein SAMN06269250_1634 [Spirosoma fluviale]